jgi:hypothetical protein
MPTDRTQMLERFDQAFFAASSVSGFVNAPASEISKLNRRLRVATKLCVSSRIDIEEKLFDLQLEQKKLENERKDDEYRRKN